MAPDMRHIKANIMYSSETLAAVWVRSAIFEGVAIGDLTTQVQERQTVNQMRRTGYVAVKYQLPGTCYHIFV